MKKKILIGGVVLILLAALIWFGTRYMNTTAETDVSSEDETTQNAMDSDEENTDSVPDSGEDTADEDTVEEETTDVSGDDPESAETDSSEEDVENVSGDDPAEMDVETVENTVSDENVLYQIETSAGNSLGVVPIVNGSAVVLLDGSYASTYQGDYSPEESSALSFKLEEVSAKSVESGRIEAWTFYRDTALRTFTFPAEVSVIEKFAFSRSSLNSIVIPEGVTSIGYGAFYHCDSLTDVVIPDSVTTIEENAFSHTPWLENWMTGDNQSEAAEDVLESSEASNDNDFLIVGDGILLAYRGSEENPELPEGVKSVVPGVFGE